MKAFGSLFSLLCVSTAWAGAQPGVPASAEPVSLDQAIKEALEKNLALLAERFNLTIADARIVQARLRPNPVLTLGLDYQDFLREGFSSAGGEGPPEWNARVDYIMERGGKRAHRVEVAENAKAVAQLQLLNTTRQLVFDVESAFTDVQAAKESLALAQENLRALEDVVQINTTRVRTGDLAQVELVRSRLAALQFRNSVSLAELKLRSAKSRLQLLIGRNGSNSFDIAGALRRDPELISLDEIRGISLKLRPDLQATVRDQARSQADIRLQIAQGKVDYTLSAVFHRQFGIVNADALGVYFSAPLPVYNRNQGEIQRATQESKQLEAKVRALQASITNDVETAFQQYSTSRSLLDTIEKTMLNEAREVRQITEYSYKRGEASLLEFLDATRAFNDTMQAYNDSRADYARSLYLLDSASGKGVNP